MQSETFTKWGTLDYDCLVHPETIVKIIAKNGHKHKGPAKSFYWFYQGWCMDVTYYRVISHV